MSDQKRTIDDLKNSIKEFCEDRNWDQFHGPKDLAIGLSTEANELLEIFRFKSDEQIKEMLSDAKVRREIADELVDSMFFVLRFAQLFEFDLSHCHDRKMQRNAEKYPVEKAKNQNQKYAQL